MVAIAKSLSRCSTSRFILIRVMRGSDDSRDGESLMEAGRWAAAWTYCLPSIGEITMEIKFSVGPSRLGSVLVAATQKGLCAVSVRESEAGAEESLRARFPKAELKRDDAKLEPTLRAVRDRMEGQRLDREVPLDLQGTDFQREVWNQLLAIPAGRTRTYLEVAQAINPPKATPAVAQACGANPVPVGGPCPPLVLRQ